MLPGPSDAVLYAHDELASSPTHYTICFDVIREILQLNKWASCEALDEIMIIKVDQTCSKAESFQARDVVITMIRQRVYTA